MDLMPLDKGRHASVVKVPYGIGSEHSVCPHEGASKATNCFLSTAAMAVSIRAPDMVNERVQKNRMAKAN